MNHVMQKFCTLPFLMGFIFATSTGAQTQTSITTERYDNSRLGAYLNETNLNVSNVSVGQFGKIFSYSVDGSVQAQPLYVPNVAIPGQGTHNVLYVPTMNDVLYAFDADSNNKNGGVLWSVDFRNPGAGVTPIPIVDIVGSNNLNIVGNVGIEGTPVIDPNTNTLYLVARTKEVSGTSTNYVARLHAIDITSGIEKFGGPSAPIQASVPGTGNGSSGGTLNFDTKLENQRPSLALANGLIVVGWGSHEDLAPWHGWIMTYNAQTLQQTSVLCTSPNGTGSGIWMSGRAPTVDSNGNLYLSTGNGDYNPGTKDYGDSVLKLGTTGGNLSLLDWFTPDTYQTLYTTDQDLGSTSPILLPGTDLLVTSGKDSNIYVMHSASLGHEQTGNGQIVQVFSTAGTGAVKGGLIFWNRTSGVGPTMYVWPENTFLQAYHFNGATLDIIPISESTVRAASGSSGGVLTVSANGSTPSTGIVWSSMPLSDDGDHGVHQGVLRAFDANDLTKLLWDSTMNLSRDDMGLWPKYSPPTVMNGKVYMASFSNVVNVYGLLSQFADFGMSVTPAVQAVSPGGSSAYTISTTAQAGFNSSVTYSVSGLPAGATVSFSPTSGIPPGSSTLTVTTLAGTSLGTYTLTITGTAGQITHTATAYLNVANAGQGTGVMSVKFAGLGNPMGSSEVAGVVAKSNWNNATGATSSSPLILFDESNLATTATISWTSDNSWSLPITDQPGNARMMRGYLDTGNLHSTIINVGGLPSSSGGYSVFVYADGDNGAASRSATYQISGNGIATTSISLTDLPNTNFSGTFSQANNSSGNYVVFTNINASSFSITATPGAASDNTLRAPINGIQIVPLGQITTADFTLSASPASSSVTLGNSTTYTVGSVALNGFSGTINLSVTGLPSLATGSFSPSAISAGASSTLTVSTAANTPVGSYPLNITGTSGSLSHTVFATLNVTSSGGSSSGVISIQFVGSGTAMANTELAGVIPESHWNTANGGTPVTPLALVDQTGASTGATVTWTSDNLYNLSIADQPGNSRMMRGYLDDRLGNPTTVTVSGLPANSSGYNVYVYADGSNGGATRTGNYQISGTGITTTSISLTDAANTNFGGTFTQANNSNGNYVVFTINATAFTVTATPGAASDGTPRAPINGIQIVPAGPPVPDFTLSATPAAQSVIQGGSTSYTVSAGALNGFTGAVSLSATGLPTGASPAFSPASIAPGASSTLTITTATTTPTGNPTITITGTNGTLTHSATVTLTVNAAGGSGSPAISIDFVGSGTAMANTELAGVVAKSHWNNANAASSSSPLALVDETGSATSATVSWNSDNVWSTPITDQPGNVRMMKGYLDTGSGHASTVTVSGLASSSSGYNVYVYADGDNAVATRSATYQISGTAIATTSIGLTDPANTNFVGTFTQANSSNGNYVVFLVNATSFTISAIPGTASDGTPRAPINGIQIVPVGP